MKIKLETWKLEKLVKIPFVLSNCFYISQPSSFTVYNTCRQPKITVSRKCRIQDFLNVTKYRGFFVSLLSELYLSYEINWNYFEIYLEVKYIISDIQLNNRVVIRISSKRLFLSCYRKKMGAKRRAVVVHAPPQNFEIYYLADAISWKKWGQSLSKLTNFFIFPTFF